MDFNWVVHDDLCGSDHFPTFLNYDGRPTPEYTPRWNFKKADWDEFKNKCKSELIPAFVLNGKFKYSYDIIYIYIA